MAEDAVDALDAVLHEVLIDEVGSEAWLRFRFVAPAIARAEGRYSFADVEKDMAGLCSDLALGYMSEHGLVAEKVAISLADRAMPLGVADPDATQFIEVYSVRDGTCRWEAF